MSIRTATQARKLAAGRLEFPQAHRRPGEVAVANNLDALRRGHIDPGKVARIKTDHQPAIPGVEQRFQERLIITNAVEDDALAGDGARNRRQKFEGQPLRIAGHPWNEALAIGAATPGHQGWSTPG